MRTKMTVVLGVVAATSAQLVDDFSCPDEFAGYYPHLISCDKYWHCQDGFAELKTCGNGLGFLDTDDTFTLEQCAELHLVECGARTEIEPPISTDHCPRLYGTFPDEQDCGVFWKCQDGKPNKYNCPPGLAYDQVSRGCRWADQVPECSKTSVTIDEDGGEFQCPLEFSPGVFTKHAHPADCRQYFLCIGGTPREYGCPLGTVFDVGSGSGVDGKCTDPEAVPECASYYGDADLGDISRSGFDTGPVSQDEGFRPRPATRRNQITRNQNAVSRGPSSNVVRSEEVREKSRPAPASLQEIVDNTPPRSRPPPPRPSQARPSQSRPSPPRPSQSRPSQSRPSQFRPREEEREEPATLPPRLQQIRIEPQETTQRAPSPSRLQVLTDRPNIRTTFPKRPTTTERTTTVQRQETTNSRFSTAGRTSPVAATTTAAPGDDKGLPAPVKAAPGPNGEEYYYYYYYYDDDEKKNELEAAPGS